MNAAAKSVTDVMKVVGNLPAEPVAASKPALDPETVEVVHKLFVELQGIFPAWRQAWPTTKALGAAKRTWVKGLMRARINSIEQLRSGIEACRELSQDFVPSVGRFVKMCRPSPAEMNMPTEEQAWREAVVGSSNPDRFRWSHEAVHLAGRAVGWFHIRQGSLSEEVLFKRFSNAYDQLVRRVVMGLPLEEPKQALEDQREGAELTPDQAARRGEMVLQNRLQAQGLSGLTGQQARAQMLASLGIHRGDARG